MSVGDLVVGLAAVWTIAALSGLVTAPHAHAGVVWCAVALTHFLATATTIEAYSRGHVVNLVSLTVAKENDPVTTTRSVPESVRALSIPDPLHHQAGQDTSSTPPYSGRG